MTENDKYLYETRKLQILKDEQIKKLVPCPFCKGKDFNIEGVSEFSYIRCQRCSATSSWITVANLENKYAKSLKFPVIYSDEWIEWRLDVTKRLVYLWNNTFKDFSSSWDIANQEELSKTDDIDKLNQNLPKSDFNKICDEFDEVFGDEK